MLLASSIGIFVVYRVILYMLRVLNFHPVLGVFEVPLTFSYFKYDPTWQWITEFGRAFNPNLVDLSLIVYKLIILAISFFVIFNYSHVHFIQFYIIFVFLTILAEILITQAIFSVTNLFGPHGSSIPWDAWDFGFLAFVTMFIIAGAFKALKGNSKLLTDSIGFLVFVVMMIVYGMLGICWIIHQVESSIYSFFYDVYKDDDKPDNIWAQMMTMMKLLNQRNDINELFVRHILTPFNIVVVIAVPLLLVYTYVSKSEGDVHTERIHGLGYGFVALMFIVISLVWYYLREQISTPSYFIFWTSLGLAIVICFVVGIARLTKEPSTSDTDEP